MQRPRAGLRCRRCRLHRAEPFSYVILHKGPLPPPPIDDDDEVEEDVEEEEDEEEEGLLLEREEYDEDDGTDDDAERVTQPSRAAAWARESTRPLRARDAWARIVLPPLKRSGHVTLDLCTRGGALERRTFARARAARAARDAGEALGAARGGPPPDLPRGAAHRVGRAVASGQLERCAGCARPAEAGVGADAGADAGAADADAASPDGSAGARCAAERTRRGGRAAGARAGSPSRVGARPEISPARAAAVLRSFEASRAQRRAAPRRGRDSR